MEPNRAEEFQFFRYVFQHVEKNKEVELLAKLSVSLMDVIAKQRASLADVLLQRQFVEIESGEGLAIVVLDRFLQ